MNKQIKRKNYLGLIISGIIALIIIAIVILYFTGRYQYDRQGTNIVVFKNINRLEISMGKVNSVKQVFQANNNNLNELLFVVENKEVPSTISAELISLSENSVIKKQKFFIPASESYQYINLKFPPIPASKDKFYALIINPLNSQNLKLLTVNKDRYPEGKLFTDGLESNNNLIFSFQYSTDNIYKVLLNRLPIYKPWFFRYSISFIILFILYFILVMSLINYLTKETIENNESIKHFN